MHALHHQHPREHSVCHSTVNNQHVWVHVWHPCDDNYTAIHHQKARSSPTTSKQENARNASAPQNDLRMNKLYGAGNKASTASMYF